MNIEKKLKNKWFHLPFILVLGLLINAQLQAKTVEPLKLGGGDRFLAHVATDKPIYRPGETVYIRTTVLNAFDRTPQNDRMSGEVQVKGPKGDVVARGYASFQDGVAAFNWKIPENLAGGEHTVVVGFPQQGFTGGERKFDVRSFRAPRLRSQIEFLRKGYGPGEEVRATLETKRAEGGIPASAKVTVLARVDEVEVHRSTTTVDAKGHAQARFLLPAEIARGEGSLAFIIEDGGVVETTSKTIPILLQTIELSLYPEGGDLIAGLPSRVYFEASTPAGKPADLAGFIVDNQGRIATEFRSEHEGRGRIEFIPEPGKTYVARIVSPTGVKTAFPLPETKPTGAVLKAAQDKYPPEEPVDFIVYASLTEQDIEKNGEQSAKPDQKLRLVLCQREQEIASIKFSPSPQGTYLSLTPPSKAEGALRATIYTAHGNPLAERLIYRESKRHVKLNLSTESDNFTPGQHVKVNIAAIDQDGEPVENAVVGVVATDDSVLQMVDKREQAPRLPVMVFLEPEVNELADAHVYLDPGNPKAALAVDLLLGTQGWRRFAFEENNIDAFVNKYGDKAKQALAFRAEPLVLRQPPRPAAPMPQRGAAVKDEDAGFLKKVKNLFAPVKMDRQEVPQKQEEKPKAAADLLEPMLEVAADEMDQAAAGLRAKRIAEPSYVRVYAHKARAGRSPNERTDFTETLYWSAGIKTNAKGRASLEFDLNDSVTSFKVFADAFSQTGALGAAEMEIESVRPFYVEPKLPLEISEGDRVDLPIALINGLSAGMDSVKVSTNLSGSASISEQFSAHLDARSRKRILWPFEAPAGSDELTVRINAAAGDFADSVEKKISVKPRGYPVNLSSGGVLKPGETTAHYFVIPDTVVPNSIKTSGSVFPTPLANLTKSLERLIRDPYGCFEQTSSTNYPLVMSQQYFQSHQGVDLDLIRRSSEKLSKGYERLVSFETKTKGYEWFGASPGHEALSAYGLLEFVDMAKVQSVDEEMIRRTRDWLLSKRDGKGGFKRNSRALDSFGRAPENTTSAYIVWALVEAGETGLEKEISAVKSSALASKDSYEIALAANILLKTGDRKAGEKLMGKLAEAQTKNGDVAGAATSITQSGGAALNIETTALAVTAWLGDENYSAQTEAAMRWLYSTCESGRFGSTQSTVLALRAIIAYDKARARPKERGEIIVILDGQEIDRISFDEEAQGALEFSDFSSKLLPGKHEIALTMVNGAEMPYSLAVDYHCLTPASSEEAKVRIAAKLTADSAAEGETLEALVQVKNVSDEPLPMTLAVVGLPGGLSPRHDQLKELVKKGTISFYEVMGRKLVLYWRAMKAEQTINVPVSLIAAIPGKYTGPASSAYLYYTDELKQWADGMTIEIEPKI